jgi:hypothetical protein
LFLFEISNFKFEIGSRSPAQSNLSYPIALTAFAAPFTCARFHLYKLVTTMLTSVVRFNYNSARANQLQPDIGCSPRASSLKNPRRLIANPRLEFHVSLIRISELRFSNRKFSAILPRTYGLRQSPASSSTFQNLIETRGLENAVSPMNPATSNFLIGTKQGFPHAIPGSLATRFPLPQGLATYRLGNCSRRLFIFGISQIWM